MGLMSTLFGSSGGYPSWYKDQWRGLFDQYMNTLQGAFGTQAHQQRVGQYREGLDKQMANSTTLGNRSLGSRGFRGGNNSLFDLSKAKAITDFDINDWLKSQQGMMGGLLQGGGLMGQMGNAFYKKPTSGLFQQALPLAVGAATGNPMLAMGMQQGMNQSSFNSGAMGGVDTSDPYSVAGSGFGQVMNNLPWDMFFGG